MSDEKAAASIIEALERAVALHDEMNRQLEELLRDEHELADEMGDPPSREM